MEKSRRITLSFRAERGISPLRLRKGARGMFCPSSKCELIVWLPIPAPPEHPPLTSLRSFAPPYAEAKRADPSFRSEWHRDPLGMT